MMWFSCALFQLFFWKTTLQPRNYHRLHLRPENPIWFLTQHKTWISPWFSYYGYNKCMLELKEKDSFKLTYSKRMLCWSGATIWESEFVTCRMTRNSLILIYKVYTKFKHILTYVLLCKGLLSRPIITVSCERKPIKIYVGIV